MSTTRMSPSPEIIGPSTGANRISVRDRAPMKMNSPYVLITPVSADAIRRLDPYSDCVSPNGPSSSTAPRSSTLDVCSPSPSAGSMMYRL